MTHLDYFAAVGDAHGHLNQMTSLLRQWEKTHRKTLSFVLQVGDFEPHRHEQDLASMAAPQKYRKLGDFHQYHAGKSRFPWPIHFIGGNHEPYAHLETNPRGFEVAPNCHYLGRTRVFQQSGIKIAALTGIYSEKHFRIARPKLTQLGKVSSKGFTYFTRQDIESLLYTTEINVLLLHEWPSGIVTPEDEWKVRSQKKTLDIASIGNDPARQLVDRLRPQLVLCGHMHLRYTGRHVHQDGSETSIECLASVAQGQESFVVFSIDSEGNLGRMPVFL